MRYEMDDLVGKYQQNLFAAALSITHNAADAEDAVQNTFLKYMKDKTEFESDEHVKAWLLRTCMNQAKDIVKSFWHRNTSSMEDWMNEQPFESEEDKGLVEAVLSLPSRYSSVVHLYYYEDYSTKEISGILKIPQNTVKSRLSRGRQLLKKILEQEESEYERAGIQKSV